MATVMLPGDGHDVDQSRGDRDNSASALTLTFITFTFICLYVRPLWANLAYD